MPTHPRTTLYIFSPSIEAGATQAMAQVWHRIEWYHLTAPETVSATLQAWLPSLLLHYPATRFDVPGPDPQAELEAAIGADTLLLESHQLTEAEWDHIIALAKEAGFTTYDDRNRFLN